MNSEILDKIERNDKRMPLKWWKAGLIGGAISPMAIVFLVIALFFGANSSLILGLFDGDWWLLAAQLPLLTAIVSVALWGSHQNHLRKVISTALLGFGLMYFLMIISYGLFGIPRFSSTYNALSAAFGVSVVYAIIAVIIWFVFGRLSYFRDQVDPDF